MNTEKSLLELECQLAKAMPIKRVEVVSPSRKPNGQHILKEGDKKLQGAGWLACKVSRGNNCWEVAKVNSKESLFSVTDSYSTNTNLAQIAADTTSLWFGPNNEVVITGVVDVINESKNEAEYRLEFQLQAY